MDQIRKSAHTIERWLNQPQKVFFVACIVLVSTLLLNGTLWKLWGLYRDQDKIAYQMVQTKASMGHVALQIKQAKDPEYIERQARDKMDLIGDHDLIFVFPE